MSIKVNEQDIIQHFEILKELLAHKLDREGAKYTDGLLDAGIAVFSQNVVIPGTFIKDTNPLKEIAVKYLDYLIVGNKNEASKLIMDCVYNGIPVKDLYMDVFQVTQKETGRLWQLGKIIVAQEHFITAATQMVMSQLYPYLFNDSHKEHRIVVSCINGELHEIGIRMVADIFELSGWDAYYFGANTPQSSLISSIEMYSPQVLAISATMTYNISAVADLIVAIRKNPKINSTKIMVGGYPFSIAENLWQKIGADGFALDADSAIGIAESFVKNGE